MGVNIQGGIWVNVPVMTWGAVKGKGYKIGSQEAHLLIRRGWTRSPGGRAYAYMIPPSGVVPPFRISIEVPTQAQVLDLVRRSHESGVEWQGHVGEWPAHYKPRLGSLSGYFSVGCGNVWGVTVWFEKPEPRVSVFDDDSVVLAVQPGTTVLAPALTRYRDAAVEVTPEVTNDGR